MLHNYIWVNNTPWKLQRSHEIMWTNDAVPVLVCNEDTVQYMHNKKLANNTLHRTHPCYLERCDSAWQSYPIMTEGVLLGWESLASDTLFGCLVPLLSPQCGVLPAFVFVFALSHNVDIFIWDYLARARYSSPWSPGSCILFLSCSLSFHSFYQMAAIVPRYFTLGCLNYAWMISASLARFHSQSK